MEAAWRVVDPILGAVTPVQAYDPQTWGPAAADRLIARAGGWRNPTPVPQAAAVTAGAGAAHHARVQSGQGSGASPPGAAARGRGYGEGMGVDGERPARG